METELAEVFQDEEGNEYIIVQVPRGTTPPNPDDIVIREDGKVEDSGVTRKAVKVTKHVEQKQASDEQHQNVPEKSPPVTSPSQIVVSDIEMQEEVVQTSNDGNQYVALNPEYHFEGESGGDDGHGLPTELHIAVPEVENTEEIVYDSASEGTHNAASDSDDEILEFGSEKDKNREANKSPKRKVGRPRKNKPVVDTEVEQKRKIRMMKKMVKEAENVEKAKRREERRKLQAVKEQIKKARVKAGKNSQSEQTKVPDLKTKDWNCCYCWASMKFMDAMQHVKDFHEKYIQVINAGKRVYASLLCPFCNHSEPTLVQAKVHLDVNHSLEINKRIPVDSELADACDSIRTFKCSHSGCLMTFHTGEGLLRHEEKSHKRKEKLPDNSTENKPEPILYKFPAVNYTKHHKARAVRECYESCRLKHQRGEPLVCTYCDKKMRFHSELVVHEATHETAKRPDRKFAIRIYDNKNNEATAIQQN